MIVQSLRNFVSVKGHPEDVLFIFKTKFKDIKTTTTKLVVFNTFCLCF